MFKNKEDFIKAVEEFDLNTRWITSDIKKMELFEDNSISLSKNGMSEILPYDESSVLSICGRADVKGGAILRVSKALFVQHLNEYFKVAVKSDSFVNVYKDRVYACHSQDYRILNIKELVKIFFEACETQFEDFAFLCGVVTPTETMCDIEIKSKDVIDTYEQALEKKLGRGKTNIRPVLRFITSNTGWSGANIIPVLYLNNARIITMIPMTLKHAGNATFEKFSENASHSYSLIFDGAQKLNELRQIEIYNPANCLTNIAKHISLPKKKIMPIAYEIDEIYGNCTCTARDIYLYICEILNDIEDPVKQFKMADQISRALTIDFKHFDTTKSEWMDKGNDRQYYYQSFNAMNSKAS